MRMESEQPTWRLLLSSGPVPYLNWSYVVLFLFKPRAFFLGKSECGFLGSIPRELFGRLRVAYQNRTIVFCYLFQWRGVVNISNDRVLDQIHGRSACLHAPVLFCAENATVVG